MRSRYTAYSQNNETYLLNTWHASTRPTSLSLHQDAAIKWVELKILHTEAGGENDAQGRVEFSARYKVNGKAQRMTENSEFLKQEGHWFYVKGQVE